MRNFVRIGHHRGKVLLVHGIQHQDIATLIEHRIRHSRLHIGNQMVDAFVELTRLHLVMHLAFFVNQHLSRIELFLPIGGSCIGRTLQSFILLRRTLVLPLHACSHGTHGHQNCPKDFPCLHKLYYLYKCIP